MKIGKVNFNLEGLVGMNKTEFKSLFKKANLNPYSLDEAWEKLKPHIPKKAK